MSYIDLSAMSQAYNVFSFLPKNHKAVKKVSFNYAVTC